MKEKYKIIMIYAEGCPQCLSMKQTIKSVITIENLNAELLMYNCEDDESLEVALDHGISNIPGCNVNGVIIEGENFILTDLIEALKKLS